MKGRLTHAQVVYCRAGAPLALLTGCAQGPEPVVEDSPTPETASPVPSEEPSPETTVESDLIGKYSSDAKLLTLVHLTIDSFDFISAYPDMEEVFISDCDISNDAVLPHIESLKIITITNENYIEVIKNNSHITMLTIGDWEECTKQLNLEGLDTFTGLKEIMIYGAVTDLSPLASCVNVEYIFLGFSPDIMSVEPLYDLPNLEIISMHSDAVAKLPKEAREHFNYREGHGYDLSRPVDPDDATIVYWT